jgi:hypothetical protein
MKYFASLNLKPALADAFQGSWLGRRYSTPLIVSAATLLLFAAAISRSFYDGRLASPLTHDDVNFFVEGIQHLTLLRTKGVFALIADFFKGSLHAPLATYQAMLAYLVFGITDWAPYVSNIVFLFVFFAFAAYLLRGCPAIVLVAALICLALLPLSSNGFTEFAPEITCSLFTAIGAVLMMRLPLIEAPFRSRFLAAFCFGLGFFAHPSAFPFTLIALLGTVGLAFLRDIVWKRKFGQLRAGIGYSLLNVGLSVWLPAFYMVPRHEDYTHYFYNALFNPATSWIWFQTSHESAGRLQHILFYLFGPGGQFMFGEKFFAYAGIIGLGLAAAWWRSDRRSLVRQAELLVLALLFWLVPTMSDFKNYLFGSPFGFLIAFMTVMALRSIYHAVDGVRGALAVAALAVLLLLFYKPAEYEFVPPNTPETAIDREFAFRAIDQFKAVLFGNAPNYRDTKVYMTNQGAYAPAILQYYMLKTDPRLEWSFDSKWTHVNPRDHIDVIHETQQDFVIAGQRGNGLTYSPIAWPAEDAVFAAMWRDPRYMALDRFYGPGGRAIAIFQRRGNFAGWRPVSGILNRSRRTEDPREVSQGLAYLQTFAARATQADLEIDWIGAKSEQKLNIFVNYQKVAELTADAETKSSSVKQKISLSSGTNDVLLQSDGALTLRYLLIVPSIDQLIVPDVVAQPQNQGISVATATYGGNCGAARGNATPDLTSSCNGKNECAYPVLVDRIGDPAKGCGKDFVASYFCPSEAAMQRVILPPEAGFGKVAHLHCAVIVETDTPQTEAKPRQGSK